MTTEEGFSKKEKGNLDKKDFHNFIPYYLL